MVLQFSKKKGREGIRHKLNSIRCCEKNICIFSPAQLSCTQFFSFITYLAKAEYRHLFLRLVVLSNTTMQIYCIITFQLWFQMINFDYASLLLRSIGKYRFKWKHYFIRCTGTSSCICSKSAHLVLFLVKVPTGKCSSSSSKIGQ